ncbi:hypothetical protein KAU45_08465 [bacterium]|nr:hypothetical protein [bacterium]
MESQSKFDVRVFFLWGVIICTFALIIVLFWRSSDDVRTIISYTFLALAALAMALTGLLIHGQFKAQKDFNKLQNSYNQSQITPKIISLFKNRIIEKEQTVEKDEIQHTKDLRYLGIRIDEELGDTSSRLTGPTASIPFGSSTNLFNHDYDTGTTGVMGNLSPRNSADLIHPHYYASVTGTVGEMRNIQPGKVPVALEGGNTIKFAHLFYNISQNFGYARFGVCIYIYNKEDQKYNDYMVLGIRAHEGVNLEKDIFITPFYSYPGIYTYPNHFITPADLNTAQEKLDKLFQNKKTISDDENYSFILSFIAFFDNDSYYYSNLGKVRYLIELWYFDFGRLNFQPLSFTPESIQGKIDELINRNMDLRK